MPVTDRRPITS